MLEQRGITQFQATGERVNLIPERLGSHLEPVAPHDPLLARERQMIEVLVERDLDREIERMPNFSNGVLSGATAMYFRKHALAGKQASKFWAGAPELTGPATHNHPSIGAAPINAAMSDSELATALRRSL